MPDLTFRYILVLQELLPFDFIMLVFVIGWSDWNPFNLIYNKIDKCGKNEKLCKQMKLF